MNLFKDTFKAFLKKSTIYRIMLVVNFKSCKIKWYRVNR